MTEGSPTITRIGVVGAGSMGRNMALGLSELGVNISLWDADKANVDHALEEASKTTSIRKHIQGYHDAKRFMASFEDGKQKILLFSVTHGSAADNVLDQIGGDLNDGDIVMDGGNEHYRNTERRQKEVLKKGVHWIGMGVSGGYQAARHGPSLSPGGDHEAVKAVLPVLKQFAAKDKASGRPCVEYIGPRGAGHFVKMIHNGIENGLLCALAEAWSLLHHALDLSNDEIGQVFGAWNREGALKNTYLVQIASEICQTKKTPKGDGHGEGVGSDGYVLDDILDKVVQDVDNSEGTGFWSVMEAAQRHIASPSIATADFIRVASANRDQRLRVAQKLDLVPPQKINRKALSLDTVRDAVYCSFLASFCQGLELIARASNDEGWKVNLGTCIQIWRAGCIIQTEHIANLLEPVFASTTTPIENLKLVDEVSAELRHTLPALKETVLQAIESDHYVPSMSASLEYVKYCGASSLPTKFMEAQLDFFGAHAFDRPGEDEGKPKKGAHHYEWRAA